MGLAGVCEGYFSILLLLLICSQIVASSPRNSFKVIHFKRFPLHRTASLQGKFPKQSWGTTDGRDRIKIPKEAHISARTQWIPGPVEARFGEHCIRSGRGAVFEHKRSFSPPKYWLEKAKWSTEIWQQLFREICSHFSNGGLP